jgi:hypothetical protein
MQNDARVTEWQGIFEWEDMIQEANKTVFGN